MTTWYVTTGLSLWEGSRCWKLNGESEDRLIRADQSSVRELRANPDLCDVLPKWETVRGWLKGSLCANPNALPAAAKKLVHDYFRPECWTSDRISALPAELATLFLLFDKRLIAPDDSIRLIAGASQSEVAAVLMAVVDELKNAGRAQIASVETTKPYTLDPKDAVQFNNGIHLLWNTEIEEREGPVQFVLTGGYKAILIALAVNVARTKKSTMYYSFEGTCKLIPLHATEEGLIEVDDNDVRF